MDEKKINLARYRLEKAREEFESGKQSYSDNFLKSSLSRSYYSIFHSIRILFALEGIDSKTHKGAAHLFNFHFVKSGLLPVKMNEILTDSFEMRLDSDYEDFILLVKKKQKNKLIMQSFS